MVTNMLTPANKQQQQQQQQQKQQQQQQQQQQPDQNDSSMPFSRRESSFDGTSNFFSSASFRWSDMDSMFLKTSEHEDAQSNSGSNHGQQTNGGRDFFMDEFPPPPISHGGVGGGNGGIRSPGNPGPVPNQPDHESNNNITGSNNNGGGNNNHHYNNYNQEDKDEILLSSLSKTRWVKCARLCLFSFLLTAAVSLGATTWYVLARQEEDHLEDQFQTLASIIDEGLVLRLKQHVHTLQTLSVSYTSSVSYDSWPNVTLPNFAIRWVQQPRPHPVSFAPIIDTDPERIQWESYAVETYAYQQATQGDSEGMVASGETGLAHPSWSQNFNRRRMVQEANHFEEYENEETGQRRQLRRRVGEDLMVPTVPDRILSSRQFIPRILADTDATAPNRTIPDRIYQLSPRNGDKVDSIGPPPYVPTWQTTLSPPEDYLMFNQFSDAARRKALEAMVVKGSAVLSAMVSSPGQGAVPRSLLFFPVLRDFTIVNAENVVGTVVMDLSWNELLNGLLPSTSPYSVNVYIENTCGQTELFFLQGVSGVVYSNQTSLSVPRSGLRHILLFAANTEPSNKGGNKLLRSPCEYRLIITPTSQFVGALQTTWPIAFGFVVLAVFLCASAFLFVYDRLVERRQSHVLETAVQTHAIVQSLFPSTVRERLFQQQRFQQQQRQQQVLNAGSEATVTNNDGASSASGSRRTVMTASGGIDASDHTNRSSSDAGRRGQSGVRGPSGRQFNRKNSLLHHTPKLRLKNFLAQDPSDNTESNENIYDDFNSMMTEPIADLFPRTTVLFADIAGFTAWSSEREPHQVFTLLESLYRAFDQAANKLGVFKVETIGDCYVAVTGLPDPHDDHAVLMGRFAFECLRHMHVLTRKLETALGPGTTDLALRVGMHSGPVTAGVLRGEKSRFQLFGDTMNTAARMESTGQQNRIQVSQDTADLITASGKGQWLIKRPELIYAKGKGEMQTYWLKPRRPRGKSSSKSDARQKNILRRKMSQIRKASSSGAGGVIAEEDNMSGDTANIEEEDDDTANVVDDADDDDDDEDDDDDKSANGRSVATENNGVRKHRGYGFPKSYGFQPPRRVLSERWAELSLEDDNDALHLPPTDRPYRMLEQATKKMRLVNWNVDLLMQLLTKIVAQRTRLESHYFTPTAANYTRSPKSPPPRRFSFNGGGSGSAEASPQHEGVTLADELARLRGTSSQQALAQDEDSMTTATTFLILNEVTEIIRLPMFDATAIAEKECDSRSVTSVSVDGHPVILQDRVRQQLHDYVRRIAHMYRDVPFHNFEHASHVTMSAHKLLKRIIRPDDFDYNKEGDNRVERMRALARDLHVSTYGVSSDPLTQFAIVFSALIHDVDHTGLPNAQLVLERAHVATKFQNKSVAEQNSLAIAWEMLMERRYSDLRACIWRTDAERRRFRQLLVNLVMATDIMDKEQQLIRKNRWNKAFHNSQRRLSLDSNEELSMNRKATSVLEHIIQASDVAHTMQHWRIYCKWNQRLFEEMYAAFKANRASKDPCQGWYEGEIWFFDNYIIPLAKKLKECGVFGVASDEYLTYALENRKEWEMKGRAVCQEMMDAVVQKEQAMAKRPNQRRGTIA